MTGAGSTKPAMIKSEGKPGGTGARGRPTHDNVTIGKQQIASFSTCSETDETFFGEGYKAHRQLLSRVKTNLESRISAATER